jgi:hypothetical protein
VAGSANLTMFNYDNTYPGGSSTIIDICGTIETA